MSLRTRWHARLLRALTLPIALSVAGTGVIGGVAGAAASGSGGAPIVHTSDGAVRGVAGATFRSFHGIPFAAAPLGELRWKPPQRAKSWRGVRDATRPGSPCPALPTIVAGDASRQGSTNEDCLYLDVYTPRTVRHRVPVMVWIHGGGFVNGAGADYDARVLSAKANAVVVTINYRLGPFGFLALPGLSAESRDRTSGNLGIQDQQAALEWVRRNISRFGGDARNVTIFGESAGGASVCAHLTSPASRGLFDRAIVQSGPCTNRFRTLAAAESSGVAVAQRLGCAEEATQVACMRAKPVAAILQAGGGSLGAFGPNIDGAVLPRQVPEAIASGSFNRVPVMQGTTHDEFRLFVALLFDLPGTPLTAAQYPAVIQERFGAGAASVLAEYPLSRFASPGLALSTVVTDASFSCPSWASNRALSGHVPTFAYEFNDPDAPPFLFVDPLMPLGAFHASEIPYLFQPADAAAFFTPEQLALSDQMIRYWGRFAASGNPNGFTTPRWPRYTTRTDRTQSLAPDGIRPVTTFAEDHRCAFWASLQAA
jgi:para-nitrobenzyl esterase